MFRGNARIVEVDADKLEEISGSYSGDTIAEKQHTLRRPFRFEGNFYISVGIHSLGPDIKDEECYMLVRRKDFKDEATWYGENLTWPVTLTKEEKRLGKHFGNDWSAYRRSQPEGFYHRMLVNRGGSVWVLVGPPIVFVLKEGSVATKQLTLLYN